MNTPKTGVDYFPLDVHIDDKLELIEAEFGITGFAVVVKLWQKIYSLGYYCEWNDEVALLFTRKTGVGGSVVSEILEASMRRGIFDKELFGKYGILTSKEIQEQYLLITKRRKAVEFFEEYLLIDVPQSAKNVRIKSKNAYINPKNVSRNKQSKVKESKVNKSKGEESKASPAAKAAPPARQTYGEYNNVLLSGEELSRLKSEFPDKYSDCINRVSEYCASSGRTYNNYYATIRKWARDDKAAAQRERPNSRRNAFNNFKNSEKTDYDGLEEKLRDMFLSS